MKTILIAALLLVFAGMAQADTWTYTGNSVNKYSMNPFLQPVANPCACSLDGTVTFDAGVATSWDFTANGETFTSLNSTFGGWFGFLDPKPFGWWSFGLEGNDGTTVLSVFMGSYNDAFDKNGLGLDVGSNPGSWAAVATPEPPALLLMGLGLLIFFIGWRSLTWWEEVGFQKLVDLALKRPA